MDKEVGLQKQPIHLLITLFHMPILRPHTDSTVFFLHVIISIHSIDINHIN